MDAVIIEAGKLRHTMMLRQPARTDGSQGVVATEWNDAGEVNVDYTPMTAQKVIYGKAQALRAPATIVMRYHPEVTREWQLRWVDPKGDEHEFNISSVVDVGGRIVRMELVVHES